MVGRCNILRPQVHLRSKNILLLLGGELLGHQRFKGVDLAYRHIAANGQGCVPRVFLLVVVYVAIVGWGHDDVVVLTGSLNAAVDASPRHDGSLLGKSAFECLVPPYQTASPLTHESFHLAVDVGLQLVFDAVLTIVLQPQFASLSLTFRALLPALLRTLVATNVDELRGEHVAKLAIDRLQELEHIGITRTEHVVADAPYLPYGIWTARTP